jgi:hypothetical protein
MSDNEKFEALLDKFAVTRDSIELSAVVTDLIKSKKQLFQRLDDPRFQAGASYLGDPANWQSDEKGRLRAIAILGRLKAFLKGKGKFLDNMLALQLEQPVVSSQQLAEGDDRYYVAMALSGSQTLWVKDYCAREALLEQTAENARVQFIRILVDRSAAIEEVFDALTPVWQSSEMLRQLVPDAVSKRLKRVLSGLSGVIIGKTVEEKGVVGDASRRFVVAAYSGKPEPGDLLALRGAVDAAAEFLDNLIRARLSLLLDSSIYASLRTFKRWFPMSSWSSYAAKSKPLARLVETQSQALLLSVKQGIFETSLLDALELCAGTRDAARRKTRQIVEANPDLPEAAQAWLNNWRMQDGGVAANVTAERFEADHFIANAMLVLWESHVSKGKRDVSEWENAVNAIGSSLDALASARGLRLLGSAGEEVEFSSGIHALVGDLKETRRVKIIRPGIERVSSMGIRSILIKAICEPVIS